MASHRYMRTSEVADHFGVTTQTVRDWVRKGHIAAIRVHRTLRIPAAEVMRIELEGREQ